MAAFERVIADFLRLVRGDARRHRPRSAPGLSLARAGRWSTHGPRAGILASPVQHHHAHLAACLAENEVDGPALGVIWDGTGYGADGTIWGGEFLLGDAAGFARVAHLRPFRLPGGDAAVHEPRRVALRLLWELMGEAALDADDLAPVRALRRPERSCWRRCCARGVRSPVTTSAGRLFDGVAALVGLHQTRQLRGPGGDGAGVRRRSLSEAAYPLPLIRRGSAHRARLGAAGRGAAGRLARGVSAAIMAATLPQRAGRGDRGGGEGVGERRCALTGGCFQNRLLTERAAERLEQARLRGVAAPAGPAQRRRHQPGADRRRGGREVTQICRPSAGYYRGELCVLVFPEKFSPSGLTCGHDDGKGRFRRRRQGSLPGLRAGGGGRRLRHRPCRLRDRADRTKKRRRRSSTCWARWGMRPTRRKRR